MLLYCSSRYVTDTLRPSFFHLIGYEVLAERKLHFFFSFLLLHLLFPWKKSYSCTLRCCCTFLKRIFPVCWHQSIFSMRLGGRGVKFRMLVKTTMKRLEDMFFVIAWNYIMKTEKMNALYFLSLLIMMRFIWGSLFFSTYNRVPSEGIILSFINALGLFFEESNIGKLIFLSFWKNIFTIFFLILLKGINDLLLFFHSIVSLFQISLVVNALPGTIFDMILREEIADDVGVELEESNSILVVLVEGSERRGTWWGQYLLHIWYSIVIVLIVNFNFIMMM